MLFGIYGEAKSPYTVTLDLNKEWYQTYPSEGGFLAGIRYRLSDIANIRNISHSFHSDNLVITFTPKIDMSKAQWISAFVAAIQDMGWKNAGIIELIPGTVSTQPGGIEQVVKEASKIAGAATWQITKGLIPIAIIGVTVLLLPTILPRIISTGGKK
ncbi:MAG TPA: hypothetical protein ENG87_02780 [Candidatus Pacearchaeota archaeon]|nr:hypothetical protein [Candidatus Pacearchaeota archaeon]